MTGQVITMDVKLSVAAGAPSMVGHLYEKYLWVSGTFTATVKLQGSVDGTNWIDIHASLATNSKYAVPETCTHLRTNTTAYTDGTPIVKLMGFE